MDGADYKVVAAPRRGARKGARTAEDRFALAVEGEIRRLAADGWEYLRSDTFPSDERQGWWGKSATVYRTVMVFRRAAVPAEPAAPPVALATEQPVRWAPPPRAARAAPAPVAPAPVAPAPVAPTPVAPTPVAPVPVAPVPAPTFSPEARRADWPLGQLPPAFRAREVPPPRRAAPPVTALGPDPARPDPARPERGDGRPDARAAPEAGRADPASRG